MNIEEVKAMQKDNLSANLQMLRATSNLTVEEFCANTYLSPASYNRYVAKTHFPHPNIIKDLCDYYHLTPHQLINELLPVDYISKHPDIYFLLDTDEDIDNKLVEYIQHHFDIKFDNVIKAFLDLELKIDFLPKTDPDITIDEKQLLKEYNDKYTVDKLTRTIVHYVDNYYKLDEHNKAYNQTKITSNYIIYYQPIYIAKCKLLKALQLNKPVDIVVRFRKLKPTNPNDKDPDIYETVKTLNFSQFVKYCNNYKTSILKVFNIKD